MTDCHPHSILLFADIPGAARLYASLSENEALHAVDRFSKRMARSIDGYSGQTIRHHDNALQTSFDNADDALHCALDMQQRIADLPPVGGLRLSIRIALHRSAGHAVDPIAMREASLLLALGEGGEILCSPDFVAGLASTPPSELVRLDPLRLTNGFDTANTPFVVQRAHSPITPVAENQPSLVTSLPAPPVQQAIVTPSSERLCLRYRGKSLLLDEKTPLLTIGRDPQNTLVVDDRKSSRHHAMIEWRTDGFYLTDNSTNGTFLRPTGEQEQMLRLQAVRLAGSGQICLGSSCNDAAAEIIEFEPL